MLRIFNHYVSKTVVALLLVEIVILIGSVYLGTAIRLGDSGAASVAGDAKLENFFLSTCAFAAAMVFGMSALGMYQLDFREGLRATILRLMPSFAIGLVLLTLIFYLAPDLYFGRGILIFALAISATGILVDRLLFFKTAKFKALKSRIIFLGGGMLAKECHDLIMNNNSYHKYDIVGFVPMQSEECQVPASALLQNPETLLELANRRHVKEIVVTVQNRRGGSLPIGELLECKLHGISVIDATTFFEREAAQIRVDSVYPSWLVFGGGFDQSFARSFIKRSFDVIASGILLLVSFPAMLITIAAIFIEDGRPVFYRQERVGKNGENFSVLKFRSMWNDAEKGGTPRWASENDPRITRVGNIIRKARIDELPQILNVFRGEMSFVGPRPERPYFVKQLSEQIPFFHVRHSVKPGITGWAQVRYKYGASVADSMQKLQYDLYYVKNNSLFLDIVIMLDTLKVVLFGGGR